MSEMVDISIIQGHCHRLDNSRRAFMRVSKMGNYEIS